MHTLSALFTIWASVFGEIVWKQTTNEPCHEIMVFFTLGKPILQTRMRSHLVGLDGSLFKYLGPHQNVSLSTLGTKTNILIYVDK